MLQSPVGLIHLVAHAGCSGRSLLRSSRLTLGLATNVFRRSCLALGLADDGVGLPEGMKWPVPGKLGALIVQTLRENAKTDLTVETAPGEGTRVTIKFQHKPSLPKSN
jgi:two-component sensor histidine kinase